MLDRKVKVRAVRNIGARNWFVTLAAPEQARLVQPGQFVMLKCSADLDALPLLRRPFSVFDLHPQPRTGRPGGLDLLVKDVGAGTHALTLLRPGDEIYALGPQGRPFQIPPEGKNRIRAACLVAGGVGIAALYLLARRLTGAGIPTLLFYGGRGAADLVLREAFEQLGVRAFYCTEDGSLGERGMVTGSLEKFLRRGAPGSVLAYACGPWAMMREVDRLARARGIPCQVSLEARMGCSVGACMGCVVRTTGAGDQAGYTRVCLEGPVMESSKVDWETPPF